jgi:hypothetical protein
VQFVTNGPDIPEALLQAHEEGRVVFFCGAGISYPAGLPGFKGLVENIYQLNGTALSDIERVVSSTPRSTYLSGACPGNAWPSVMRWCRH